MERNEAGLPYGAASLDGDFEEIALGLVLVLAIVNRPQLQEAEAILRAIAAEARCATLGLVFLGHLG